MLLRCKSLEPPMSQLGHSRHFKREVGITASPQLTDISSADQLVRFMPKADICSAANKSYSITSSAATSSLSGTARPSILAVPVLMTNSNLVDCTTGKSAGLAPLRMRPA